MCVPKNRTSCWLSGPTVMPAPPTPALPNTHRGEEYSFLSSCCLMARAKGPLHLPWLQELLRQPTLPPLTSVSLRCACLLTHVRLFVTHRQQPTRLFCPWDSPGKNTGVGCHFLIWGNLPDPGIKPMSTVFPALVGGFFTTEPSGKPTNLNLSICDLRGLD